MKNRAFGFKNAVNKGIAEHSAKSKSNMVYFFIFWKPDHCGHT